MQIEPLKLNSLSIHYLGYAIGEVILVIVGILIALQINTWNQNSLLRIEEKEVISRILTDLETDLNNFGRRFDVLENKEVSLMRVMRKSKSRKITPVLSQ